MQPLATPGLFAHIAVRDTGSGVPPAIRDKIFDPFFTTKEHGKGTGLGLSTCIGIVRSHGGFMHLDSELGKGSTFSVFLPAAVGGQEEAKVAAPSASEASHGHGELILVVDDEERILEATNNLLVAHGFRTMTALDGTAALAIYSTRMSEIALVLTDLAMPHMDGIALAHVLRRMNPAVKMIAASGLPTEANRRKVAEAGVLTLIAKPYSAGDLLQAIARALAGPARG
jgi:CheY-like chemotaxis protein